MLGLERKDFKLRNNRKDRPDLLDEFELEVLLRTRIGKGEWMVGSGDAVVAT